MLLSIWCVRISVANTKTNLKSLGQALEMAKEEAMLKVKEEGKEKESSTRKEDWWSLASGV